MSDPETRVFRLELSPKEALALCDVVALGGELLSLHLSGENNPLSVLLYVTRLVDHKDASTAVMHKMVQLTRELSTCTSSQS